MGVPISNVTRRVVYAASGTGPYNFTFEILAAGDIAVYRDDTLLTLTTDYTVTINANGTGSVTLVAAPTGATQIAIVGNRTISRTTDFVTGGDFFANTLNDELDQQTIFAQQNAEGLGRTLTAPQTDPTNINMTLPRATLRANKTLGFDANGNPTLGETLGTNRGNWSSGTLYYVRDIVKDTTNNNIWQCITQHTSSGSQPINTNADSAKWTLLVDAASASTSATNAAASASAAATSASNASTSASNAASSASTASTQASNASTSATNASNSATAAASSASTASTAATNAGNSATAAATSATNASNSASSASTSASNASTSATNAANSASTATTQATNASNSASSASTSASNASTSASNASTSASNASTSATNASNSASAASTSASNAATSETNAAASAASAASALDSFDDRYLGTKASNPTLDNDGNALLAGALYFSTTENIMKVYDGASWIAATSAGNVSFLRYRYVATSGQTTFSGSDSNSATLTYTVNNVVVFLNGVSLDQTEYTATSGTSVVLGAGAALNDELVIVAFKSFVTADMVPASTGGTYAGNVTVPNLNDSGNLTFTGTGNRITGDFTNATTSNRVMFQTSTANSLTAIGVLPSGTGDSSYISFSNSSTPDNAAYAFVGVSGTNEFRIEATKIGTGTYLPMTFCTGGAERARVPAAGGFLLTSGGGGLGYGTGAGGTVTQATSKATAVTLNKPTGQITMNGAALAANTNVQFVVNNSLVSASDVVLLTINDANGPNYQVQAYVYGAGTFTVNLRNITGGSLSNALVLNFAVIKGATS